MKNIMWIPFYLEVCSVFDRSQSTGYCNEKKEEEQNQVYVVITPDEQIIGIIFVNFAPKYILWVTHKIIHTNI